MFDYFSDLLRDWLNSLGWDTLSTSADFWHRIVLLLISVIISWLVYQFSYRIIRPFTIKVVKRTSVMWDDYLLNDTVLKSLCKLLPPLVLLFLFTFIYIPGEEYSDSEWMFAELLERIIKIYVIVMFMRLGFGFINGIKQVADNHSNKRSSYLTGAFQLLKIAIIFIGAILIIGIAINKSPIALIAGLGALATVLMLVFKDPIMGFVSGIQLSANDMLRKGDWITMTSSGANGYVEDVTLTTVKVRNFDNTITTIPPYTLVSQSFQNWRGMKMSGGRRVNRSLYIDVNSIRKITEDELSSFNDGCDIKKTYVDNAEITNITAFRNAAEVYLKGLSQINQDLTVMVRQMPLTAQGIPVELYFFLKSKEWVDYEHQLSDILSHVILMLSDFGLRLYQAPSGYDIKKIV